MTTRITLRELWRRGCLDVLKLPAQLTMLYMSFSTLKVCNDKLYAYIYLQIQ